MPPFSRSSSSRRRSLSFRAPPILPFAFPPEFPKLPTLNFLNNFNLLPWGVPSAHARESGTGTGVAKLVVVNVKGDGRCLYRSIAKSLASEESRHLPPHLETEDADALRGIAWKHMCVDRAAEYVRKNIVEGSMRNYCAQMRNPSFFAGEAEILALSDALKIPISIYLNAHL